MQNNNIAELLQEILTRLAQVEATFEKRFSNIQDDIQAVENKVDRLRDDVVMQSGELEATQQQVSINKKKQDVLPMRLQAKFTQSLPP